jgi:hypothetical protein
VGPGLTVFTRTPLGPYSAAQVFVNGHVSVGAERRALHGIESDGVGAEVIVGIGSHDPPHDGFEILGRLLAAHTGDRPRYS